MEKTSQASYGAAVLASHATGVTLASRPECETHIANGNAAYDAGKYQSALDYFTDAINCDSENLASYISRAKVKHAISKPKPALYDVNLVLKKDPAYLEALEFRARIKKETGAFEDALDDYSKLQKEDKYASDAAAAKAEIKKTQGLLEGSLDKVKEAGSLSKAKFNKLLREVGQVIDAAPFYIRPLLLRARLYFERRLYDLVIADTKRILRLSSKHVQTLLLRGHAYRLKGELTMAINSRQFIRRHYKICAKKMDDDCIAHKKSAEQYQELLQKTRDYVDSRQAMKALRNIQTLLTYSEPIEHFTPELNLLKCRAYNIQKKGAEALAACKIALSAMPDEIEALLQQGEALLLVGGLSQLEQAERSFRRAIDRGSREAHDGMRRAQNAIRIAKRKDYYKILGVEPKATARAIRRAYKKAALKYHPDKLKKSGMTKEEAAAAYKDVQEAYEGLIAQVLSDNDKRRRWDAGEDVNAPKQGGFNPFQGSGFPFGGGFNFQFRRG